MKDFILDMFFFNIYMIKCVLVDRTKTLNENRSNEDYYDDITVIQVTTKLLPSIHFINNIKHNGKPYYYNLIPRKGRNELFQYRLYAKYLNLFKCKQDNLYMIHEVPLKWEANDILKLHEKYPHRNPKATMINKIHTVFGNALFFMFDGKKFIDMDKSVFIADIVQESPIKGTKIIKFDVEGLYQYGEAKIKLNELDNETYEKTKTSVFALIDDIANGKIIKCDIKGIIDKMPNVKRETYIKSMEILQDMFAKSKKDITWKLLWKGQKTKLLRNVFWEHFFEKYKNDDEKDLYRKKMMEGEKKLYEIYGKRENRYKLTIRYAEHLVTNNISTLEDVYIIMLPQMFKQYVYDAQPWYMSGPIFHSLSEYENLILKLDFGVTYNGDPDGANYLFEKIKMKEVLYPDIQKDYEIILNKHT